MFTRRIHHLPPQPTPFFGRHIELAELTRRLIDPAYRLITVTGAGGIGKTRLAIRAATDVLHSFAHGVWFVPLQPIRSAAVLPTAVADVLELPFSAPSDPHVQLRNYLSDKDILLILDNYEHLLREGGAEILPDLLAAAPALRLLVTSREALQLQEEWRYPLGGMLVPPDAQVDDIERYGLIQLFVERAQRVRHDFSLADEKAAVVRVCQLVEGVPLAVELAASWTDVLRCDDIAARLGQGLAFLHTSLRNIPARHRSLRAVFDQSWTLLSADERGVFQQLAVFRGGFRQEAADTIAGAALPILASLARQSLLTLASDGRYQIHELLRQYADERLAHTSSEAAFQTHDRHCIYYTTFLRDRNAAINSGQQLHAIAEIAAELDNVRAAWQWAIERRNIAALVDAANALFLFCQFRSRYLEGIQLFEQAVRILDDAALAAHSGAPLLLYELGWLCIRLGRLQDAQAYFERCHAVYRHLQEPPRHAHASDPRLGLGLLASLRGDYTGAQQLLEEVRRLSERDGHLGNQQTADYFLAGISLARGQYQAAQRYARAAYEAAELSQDRWFMAFCLNELGHAARALGEYEQAGCHYQTSYRLREEFGDPGGMAVALTHLGSVAMLQGNIEAAEDGYRRSLAIYRDIDDQGGLVAGLDGLGQVCCARGQVQPAARHLNDALHIAASAHFITLQLSLLISIAQLLLRTGRQEQGLAVLTFVAQHSATTSEERDRARRLLAHYPRRSPPYDAEAIQGSDLEGLTTQLQADLTTLEAQSEIGSPPRAPMQPAADPLIESLTPRERELLPLLAAGLSYQEIAAQLMIAVGSVKSHAHNIYGKLGVRNRVQAAARAADLGLL